MASAKEAKVCWQCSEFSNIFPELMTTIENLKKRHQRTNEDSVIKCMISNGNKDITSDDVINDVFSYAVETGYLMKREYNGDFSYKISGETENVSCASCGETIIPFKCNVYKLDAEVKYVSSEVFETLANEVYELKAEQQSIKQLNDAKGREFLLSEIDKKDKIINILLENLSQYMNNSHQSNSKEHSKNNNQQSQQSQQKQPEHVIQATTNNLHSTNNWQPVKHGAKQSVVNDNDIQNSILNIPQQANRYEPLRLNENNPNGYGWNLPLSNKCFGIPQLYAEESVQSDDELRDTNYQQDLHQQVKPKTRNTKHSTRVFPNNYPERDILPLRNAVNQSTENTKKIVIVSDSMTKPIDMVEFNDLINNGCAVKRAYGGKTASFLNHCAYAAIKEDKPNTMIICAGTNNLTKKKQTPEQIALEIMDIVNTCNNEGVEKVYVSSIICRPSHQEKVDEINELLQYYTSIYDFRYIDNSSIQQEHLTYGNVHLNDDGINLLSNNYLSQLNRKPITFHNLWD